VSTSREVMENLFRGRKAERVGLTEWFWPDTLSVWVEQGYPTRPVYKEVGERRWRRQDGMREDVETAGEYEEPVPAWQQFGFDMDFHGIIDWFDLMPLRGHSEVVEETEGKLWSCLRRRQLCGFKFRRHHPVGCHIVDFYCPSCRLVVEIEGDSHVDREDYDAERTARRCTQRWTE